VYFPPLAWLVTAEPELPLLFGWQDITEWAAYSLDEEHFLPALVDPLPQVSQPHHTPILKDQWIEMFAGADALVTEIVECSNLPRGDFAMPRR
jgi:hypothetical protein